MEVLLVSTEYIKARSSIFENVNDKVLREAINDSQTIYIEPLLGSPLYDEIIAEVEADNVSTANKTLLDEYIVPTLKFYALFEASVFVTTAYTPTGAKKLVQESSAELTPNEFKAYQDKWQSRGEFFAKKAILFLKQESNDGNYPLYKEVSDRLDDVGPDRTQYTSRLYLGGKGSSNCSSEYYDYET